MTSRMTFAACAEKHAENLRSAARDLAAAKRDDPTAIGADVTRLHRAMQGIGHAAQILDGVAAGAYAPSSYTPASGIRRNPQTGQVTEVR